MTERLTRSLHGCAWPSLRAARECMAIAWLHTWKYNQESRHKFGLLDNADNKTEIPDMENETNFKESRAGNREITEGQKDVPEGQRMRKRI